MSMTLWALGARWPTADEVPQADDVVAGFWGAVIFIFLIVAGVVLFLSLTRHLRKAQAAKDAGLFGDSTDRGAADVDSDGDIKSE